MVEVSRKCIVTAGSNARRKEGLAKKKADKHATYEATYFKER
jgi:hypothetical protein